jgi:hypothetical protein
VISPAYAGGIGDNLRIRVNGPQWVGIKDAPDNQSLYADFRIADRSGVGTNRTMIKKRLYESKPEQRSPFAHHLI